MGIAPSHLVHSTSRFFFAFVKTDVTLAPHLKCFCFSCNLQINAQKIKDVKASSVGGEVIYAVELEGVRYTWDSVKTACIESGALEGTGGH